MGRDPTTIRRFINKYKTTGSTGNLPRSGRPPALNIVEKNAPLHEVVNSLSLNCSLTTVKTTLHEAGIYSHVAAKKPFISERHAAVRISWCKKYKEKPASYWNQVIFSDGS